MSIIHLDTNMKENNITDNMVKKQINKLEKEIRDNIANICDIESNSPVLNTNKPNNTNIFFLKDDLPISNFSDFNLMKFLNLFEKDLNASKLYQKRHKKKNKTPITYNHKLIILFFFCFCYIFELI